MNVATAMNGIPGYVYFSLSAYICLGICVYLRLRQLYRRSGHDPDDLKLFFRWLMPEDLVLIPLFWPFNAALAWWSWYAGEHRLRARRRYEAAKARVRDPNEKFQRMSLDELIAAQKKVLSEGPKDDRSSG